MASSNGKVSTVDSSHRRGEGWKTHQKLLMEVFLNELKASMMEEILCRGNDKFNGAVAQSEVFMSVHRRLTVLIFCPIGCFCCRW